MATFIWSDDGDGPINSRRWCQDQVNAAGPGPHTIDCQLTPGATVNLLSPLPVILEDTIVSGIANYGDVTINCSSMGAGNGIRIDTGRSYTDTNTKWDAGNAAANINFVYVEAQATFSFTGCGWVNNTAGSAQAALLICEPENANGLFEECIFEDVAESSTNHYAMRADGDPVTKGTVEFRNCTGTRLGTLDSRSCDVIITGGVYDNQYAYTVSRHTYMTGAGVNTNPTLTLTDVEIKNYTAENGPAGRFDGDVDVTVTGCTITGNRAPTNFGGGFACSGYSGTFQALYTHFEDNEANWTGGAVHFNTSSPTNSPYFLGCSFKNNRSLTQDGGAIFWGGTLVNDVVAYEINCTFDSNIADRWGGAERNSLSSNQRVKRYFCTYKSNRCGINGGGAIYNNGGDSRSESCVYVDNLEGAAQIDIRVTSGTFNGSYNLVYGVNGANIVDGANNNKVGAAYNYDVLAIADNGGAVPTCRMLATCSGYLTANPADPGALGIDYDGRGSPYVRVFVANQPCMGAYEVQPDPSSVTMRCSFGTLSKLNWIPAPVVTGGDFNDDFNDDFSKVT